VWEDSSSTQGWTDPSPLQLLVVPHTHTHTPQLRGHKTGSGRAMMPVPMGSCPSPPTLSNLPCLCTSPTLTHTPAIGRRPSATLW
ncbi:unnamed protein product, partial [Gulo gulo]